MAEFLNRPPRKATNLLIRLNFPNEAAFAERYATNVSSGGMFIRTREPKPVGARLQFGVELANGARVLRGTAVVAWVRGPGDPKGPPGMGVRFEELDPASRAFIDRMTGGQELPSSDRPAAAESAPPKPAPALSPEFPEEGFDLNRLIADTLGDTSSLAASAPISLSPPAAELCAVDPLSLVSPVSTPARPLPPAGLDLSDAELDQARAPAEAKRTPTPAPAARATPLPSIRRTPVPAAPPKGAAPVLQAKAPAARPAAPSTRRPVFLPAPGPVEGTGPIIGIDLGTTNSCVAVFNKGKPTVLRSKEGYWTTPSVLSVTAQGKVLAGHRARQQLILNPGRTLSGAKRLVGRDFQSPTVQQTRGRLHYELVPDDAGRAAVKMGEDAFTLEEAQALLLRELKELAERELGTRVERAVITCPASYSEPQRQALRRAGALAGLKVERILNDPTAAALAFGVNKELSKKVLVYDLGGGTFDATVLRIDSNVFEVLATGGDVFLGGADFDHQIVDFLLEDLAGTPGFAEAADAVVFSRLGDAAERAKVVLSERQSHEVALPMVLAGKDGPVDLRKTLTRADLERLVGDLVDRTVEMVREVLAQAQLAPAEIDEVLLVGGQSRMPLVHEKLAALFGKPAHASVNADEAVALGAALYASTIDKVCSVVLIDVVPMTLGMGLAGGVFRRVIERNTSLPAQRSLSVPTMQDDQTVMEVSLFQGEDPSIAGNEYLGTVRIEGIPPAPKGSARVAVTLKLDAECVLHVEALELTSRKRLPATLSSRYTLEQLRRQLSVSRETLAEARRGRELEQRAGRFWSFVKPQKA